MPTNPRLVIRQVVNGQQPDPATRNLILIRYVTQVLTDKPSITQAIEIELSEADVELLAAIVAGPPLELRVELQ